MHHIIADGQSFGVVIAEMNRLYNAFDQGQQSPMPELSVQYVDYSAWQRQWLQGEVLETRLAYWRKQLHRRTATTEPAAAIITLSSTKVQSCTPGRSTVSRADRTVAGVEPARRGDFADDDVVRVCTVTEEVHG